jgi:hypothetical protein
MPERTGTRGNRRLKKAEAADDGDAGRSRGYSLAREENTKNEVS